MRLAVAVLTLALSGVNADAAPTAAVDATPGWLGDLAFDSTHNRWLVVSHSGLIYARLMDNDGKPVSAAFVVSAAEQRSGWAPMAAYSPDADQFLVVWADDASNSALLGRFVSSSGGLGVQFSVPTADVPGVPMLNVGGDRTSALRYDAANRRFVLVWEHRDPTVRTKLTTIDLQGRRGPVLEVGTLSGRGNWGPSVAVNGDRNEYCVAYDQRNAGRLAVSRIAAGSLSGGSESAVGIQTVNTEIAYNSKSKKYVLMYDAGYGVGVKARLLNSCNAADTAGETLLLPKQGYASIAANPRSDAYAAIGQNAEDMGNHYTVASPDGRLIARQNPFPDGRHGHYLPVIRANTSDGTFAAITSRDYGITVFVARIGSGEGVEVPPSTGPAANLGWSWLSPASGREVSGVVRVEGEASADVKAVDILVNLQKVGSAALADGRWRYELDTRAYSGGVNLSALVADAVGKSGRHTIRVSVHGGAAAPSPTPTPTPSPTPAPTPAGRNGAAFVRQRAPPAVMRPGQSATVSITVRNSGETPWTASRGYKLGSQGPSDNANWRFGRVLLSAATVERGWAHTFTFSIKAPDRPGTYAFQWRMSQDRVQWFGQATPLRRIVVKAD